MNDFMKLKNSLVSVIGCVINLNEYNCASLKIPWGEFLISAHLTIENNIGKTTTDLIVYYRRVRRFSNVGIKNSRLDRLHTCLVGVAQRFVTQLIKLCTPANLHFRTTRQSWGPMVRQLTLCDSICAMLTGKKPAPWALSDAQMYSFTLQY